MVHCVDTKIPEYFVLYKSRHQVSIERFVFCTQAALNKSLAFECASAERY